LKHLANIALWQLPFIKLISNIPMVARLLFTISELVPGVQPQCIIERFSFTVLLKDISENSYVNFKNIK